MITTLVHVKNIFILYYSFFLSPSPLAYLLQQFFLDESLIYMLGFFP